MGERWKPYIRQSRFRYTDAAEAERTIAVAGPAASRLASRQIVGLPDSTVDEAAGASQTTIIALSVTFGSIAIIAIMALISWAIAKQNRPRRRSGARRKSEDHT